MRNAGTVRLGLYASLAGALLLSMTAAVSGQGIDLGDIVAAGDGKGNKIEPVWTDFGPFIGIDQDTGVFQPVRIATDVPDTDGINPIAVDGSNSTDESPWIDSVFVMNNSFMPINSAGVNFGFANGDIGDGWEFLLDGFDIDGPDRLGIGAAQSNDGIGLHSSAGITFNLDELRATHGAGDVQYFSTVAGDGDLTCVGSGTVRVYVILSNDSGILDARRFGPFQDQGVFVQFAIPANARYLTLATGAGDDGNGCDHGAFVDAFITAAPVDPPSTTITTVDVPDDFLALDPGQSGRVQVLGTLDNGLFIDLATAPETSYAIDDTSVATVSADGLVTGVARGNATLTVTHGDLSDTVDIRVPSLALAALPALAYVEEIADHSDGEAVPDEQMGALVVRRGVEGTTVFEVIERFNRNEPTRGQSRVLSGSFGTPRTGNEVDGNFGIFMTQEDVQWTHVIDMDPDTDGAQVPADVTAFTLIIEGYDFEGNQEAANDFRFEVTLDGLDVDADPLSPEGRWDTRPTTASARGVIFARTFTLADNPDHIAALADGELLVTLTQAGFVDVEFDPPTPTPGEHTFLSSTLLVGQEPIEALQVVPGSGVVNLDDVLELRALATTGSGGIIGLGDQATFVSDAPDVASVDANGNVTGVGAGLATITVTFDDPVSGTLFTTAALIEVGDFIDLGDIVSAGDGKGNKLPIFDELVALLGDVIAVDQDFGRFEALRFQQEVGDINSTNPTAMDGLDANGEFTDDSPWIDSVFVINPENIAINSAGVRFDFVGDDNSPGGWEFILDGREPGGPEFMKIDDYESQRGIGIHASAGLTFDLDALRNTHGADAVQFFSAGAGELTSDTDGTVHNYVILSDASQIIDSVKLGPHNDSGEIVEVAIPAEARFLTLAVGDAGDGIGSDHGGFIDAFISRDSIAGAISDFVLIAPDEISLLPSQIASIGVSATFATRGGLGIDLGADPRIVYESSDPSVATIDAAGVITGVAGGEATITATFEDRPLGTVSVVVIASDCILRFQAEDFDDRTVGNQGHEWTVVPDESAGVGYVNDSGGKHLESLPGGLNNNSGNPFDNGPVVSYGFTVNTAGDYRIWVRAAANEDVGGSNSFYLRIRDLGAGGNPGDWWRWGPVDESGDFTDSWQGDGGLGNQLGGDVNNAEPMIESLAAGDYTLEIAMRESGSGLDEIIIDGLDAFDGTDAIAALIPMQTVQPDTCVGGEPPALVGDDTAISVLGCDVTDATFETNEGVTVGNVTTTMSDGSAGPGVTVTSGSLQISLDAPLSFYEWLRVDVEVTGQTSNLSATLTVFMAHTPLDINGDGRTNISDATAFGSEFNGAKDPNLIDVNCDGTVDIRDATAFGTTWNAGAANSGPLPAKPG